RIVANDAGLEPQALGKFLLNHRRRVAAENDMDLVIHGIKGVQQALRVKRAAGTGDCHEISHVFRGLRPPTTCARSWRPPEPAARVALPRGLAPPASGAAGPHAGPPRTPAAWRCIGPRGGAGPT